MTLNLFKRMIDTESDNPEELLSHLEDAKNEENINMLEYAQIKSDINMRYYRPELTSNVNHAARYTVDEVLTVTKSHLDVYNGIKNISAHLNLMKQLFGEESSQFRNGAQYNRRFHRTLDEGEPSLGHSMPSNWADATLELVKDRPTQFKNTLDACQKIYDSTGNGNMLRVINKWRLA